MAGRARIPEGHPRSRSRARARRRFVGAAGVAVAVCIALAAPGFAFASRATRGVVVPKLSSGSVTATCPKGEHVSFGGVVAQFQAPPRSGAIVLPEGMRRTAPDRWTVSGTSSSAVTGSRLTAIAYCAQGAVPASTSASVKLEGSSSGSAIAACPSGTVVVGGGYNAGASPTHSEVVVRLDAPTARQWRVTALNISGAATTLTALAYCARGVAPAVRSTSLTLNAHKGGTARVSCPKGKSIVFGGLAAHSPLIGKQNAVVAPFSWTAASNSQWVVTGYNAGDVPGSLEALIYCR